MTLGCQATLGCHRIWRWRCGDGGVPLCSAGAEGTKLCRAFGCWAAMLPPASDVAASLLELLRVRGRTLSTFPYAPSRVTGKQSLALNAQALFSPVRPSLHDRIIHALMHLMNDPDAEAAMDEFRYDVKLRRAEAPPMNDPGSEVAMDRLPIDFARCCSGWAYTRERFDSAVPTGYHGLVRPIQAVYDLLSHVHQAWPPDS